MPSTTDVQIPCKSDPDRWFADSHASQRMAARQCNPCPIVDRCLALSLEREEEFGVWGGITARERNVFLAQRRGESQHGSAERCLPATA